MKNKLILITLCALIAALGGYFYLSKVVAESPALSDLKCPDDYKNVDDSAAAFKVFVYDFTRRNPGASDDDLADARLRFYVEHNCTAALKRRADYLSGNTDPATMKMADDVIKESGIQ